MVASRVRRADRPSSHSYVTSAANDGLGSIRNTRQYSGQVDIHHVARNTYNAFFLRTAHLAWTHPDKILSVQSVARNKCHTFLLLRAQCGPTPTTLDFQGRFRELKTFLSRIHLALVMVLPAGGPEIATPPGGGELSRDFQLICFMTCSLYVADVRRTFVPWKTHITRSKVLLGRRPITQCHVALVVFCVGRIQLKSTCHQRTSCASGRARTNAFFLQK